MCKCTMESNKLNVIVLEENVFLFYVIIFQCVVDAQ